MDLLLNTLTEWLKELLAGAIASNLTGMVDSVNTKVGDIAAQVGQTPQGWNSGIFSMIQNLSNNVILPIAGIILALVMTMEFIRIIMDMWRRRSCGRCRRNGPSIKSWPGS